MDSQKNSISRIAKIYLYRMSGLPQKLNIQKCVYSTENLVQYNVQHVWIGREIECPELHTGNCVHNMCGMSVFAK